MPTSSDLRDLPIADQVPLLPPHRPPTLRLIRLTSWAVTIVVGLLQTWGARFSPSPDATNYLDMAGAALRGDWKNAVNAYWSPLYPGLLALCLEVLKPPPSWESSLLQLLNFAGLLVTLACFEYFFRCYLKLREQTRTSLDKTEPPSDATWWMLGYGLFLSTAFFVQTVTPTTPDVWVSALTFVAAGLVLKIRTNGGGWRLFAQLGFVLGCAYLAKAVYFPLAFVFLLTACLAAGISGKTWKQATVALFMFVLLAGPWIALLSRSKNRITFGDVGRLAYVRIVDQLPRQLAWQGENGTGVPTHPIRELLSSPRVYEFAAPIEGTYPPAFDWSYWMEGARPRFDFRGQVRALRQSLGTFFVILVSQIEYLVAVLSLFFAARSNRLISICRNWFLWLPPAAACAAYSLVLVEGRYVAPFVLLLWLAGFSSLLGLAPPMPRRLATAMILAVISVTGLRLAKSTEEQLTQSQRDNVSWEVAQALRNLGIRPGDSVSSIAAAGNAEWARLAGVRIVSEIPWGEQDVFWTADPATQRNVFHLFAGTGAKAVVTKNPTPAAIDQAWIRLGETQFYAHALPVQ